MSSFDPFNEDPFLDHEDEYLSAPSPAPFPAGETEQLLLRLRDVIEGAPTIRMSNTPKVTKDELLELLNEAVDRLPEELRAARWLLKEREEFLDKVRHEGEEIVNLARDRAERMVQRTEVVKAAESRAYQILDNAESEARRLRHEVEDFCDQKLASFEIVLERTQKLVTAGRTKLQGTALAEMHVQDDESDLDGIEAFSPRELDPPDDGYENLPPPPGA